MRTDRVVPENKEKKFVIVGVKRIENTAYTKSFDYYYKRALTRSEQTGEVMPNLTSNEIFEMQRANSNNELNSERKRVREFKKGYSAKVGHAAYEKNIEDTAEMQEKQYRRENSIDEEINEGR